MSARCTASLTDGCLTHGCTINWCQSVTSGVTTCWLPSTARTHLGEWRCAFALFLPRQRNRSRTKLVTQDRYIVPVDTARVQGWSKDAWKHGPSTRPCSRVFGTHYLCSRAVFKSNVDRRSLTQPANAQM